MTAQYQFVMRAGPNTGKIYPLEGMQISIGRDSTNAVAINDAEVSRKHAKLIWQENGYILEDLGSTNGTFVNGQRISAPCPLRGGETIAFGEGISLVYEATADPNATMVSSKARVAAGTQGRSRPQAAAKPAAATPAYTGQVPAGPQPASAKPEKKKFKPLLLVGIIVAVVVCACAVSWLIMDTLNLYCTILPFLFPACGG